MSLHLPEPIATYVDAANAGDSDRASLCFTESATVLDEGELRTGRKAIRDWMVKSREKYHYRSQPLEFQSTGNQALLTARLTGNFPGSPLVLAYQFQLAGNLIQDLRIVPAC